MGQILSGNAIENDNCEEIGSIETSYYNVVTDMLIISSIYLYTKKDGSTYEYINFSKMNLMNALKAVVYNINWKIRDIASVVLRSNKVVNDCNILYTILYKKLCI